jgi:hypothetical protein
MEQTSPVPFEGSKGICTEKVDYLLNTDNMPSIELHAIGNLEE